MTGFKKSLTNVFNVIYLWCSNFYNYLSVSLFNANKSDVSEANEVLQGAIEKVEQELKDNENNRDIVGVFHYNKIYSTLRQHVQSDSQLFNNDDSPVKNCCLHFAYTQSNREQNQINGWTLHVKDWEPGSANTYTPDQLIQIANALSQLVLCYNSSYRINSGLYPLIIRPFLDLVRKDPRYEDFRKNKAVYLSFNKIFNKIRNDIFTIVRREKQTQDISDNKTIIAKRIVTDAIVKLQRASRLTQNRKKSNSDTSSNFLRDDQALRVSVASHGCADSKAPADIAVNFAQEKKDYSTQQSKTDYKEFAQQSKTDYKEFAQEFSRFAVHYRSHKKFLRQLEYVMNRFNQYMSSLKEDTEYFFVVPDSGRAKSNHWVVGLALRLNLIDKKPSAVLFPEEVKGYLRYKPSNKDSVCVFLDDAMYSGRQLAKY